MEASPQRLLIKIYDLAIVSCQKQDLKKTNEAIQTLINALSFDTDEVKEISLGLMRLYQFCRALILLPQAPYSLPQHCP